MKKDLDGFYSHLLVYYGLGPAEAPSDSIGSKTKNVKAQAKLNAYKDSLLSIKYKSLPIHYQEALVLYNSLKSIAKHPIIKQDYLNESLVKKFNDFRKAATDEKKKQYGNTYWWFYVLKENRR